MNLTLEQRFWRHVDKTGDCWEWTRSRKSSGYGQFRVEMGATPQAAHRVAWELSRGPIPAGLFVCHHCDNRLCVRPDHLFVGTAQDNARDKMEKGRGNHVAVRGELCGRAKLTEAQARAILEEHAVGGVTYTEIARRYGVYKGTVRNIVLGYTWGDLQRGLSEEAQLALSL